MDSYHATFRAVGEGTAHVSLTADNGFRTETLTGDVQVMRADSATLAPVVLPTTLSLGWKPLVTASCAEPYRIQTGAPLDLEYELAAGGIPLRADDYCPFSSPALAFGACEVGTYMRNGTTLVTTQTLVATAAAVPQSATIGSDVDPGVAIAVDLVDAAAVDGVQLSDPVIVDSRKYLFAWATSGGVPLCSDALERTIVSETPDLCEVLDRDFPGPRAWKRPGLYEVWPKAKGMCRIRATLVATGLTTVREYATY